MLSDERKEIHCEWYEVVLEEAVHELVSGVIPRAVLNEANNDVQRDCDKLNVLRARLLRVLKLSKNAFSHDADVSLCFMKDHISSVFYTPPAPVVLF